MPFKPENRLLATLDVKERRRVLERATTVSMEMKTQLYDKNKKIQQVYFPITGVYSIVSDTKNGRTAEVATVGNEGILGLPIFFRTETVPLRCFVQIPGESLMLQVEDFRQLTRDMNAPLCQLLYRYTQALFNQLAQHAACNSLHDVQKRCARWLLMSHDRVGSDDFPLTHEFLAQMLGVRRASVTEVARKLQSAGLITYRQGIMTVIDRKGLERAACEHYRLIRDEYDRLTPS
ncbi:MAG TPA: Crp/Fnr family transcriptional regulator [Nitrospira sp.]|nr:Crp/Fnr family transcriptional regulator [Nitrospira sp.]